MDRGRYAETWRACLWEDHAERRQGSKAVYIHGKICGVVEERCRSRDAGTIRTAAVCRRFVELVTQHSRSSSAQFSYHLYFGFHHTRFPQNPPGLLHTSVYASACTCNTYYHQSMCTIANNRDGASAYSSTYSLVMNLVDTNTSFGRDAFMHSGIAYHIEDGMTVNGGET